MILPETSEPTSTFSRGCTAPEAEIDAGDIALVDLDGLVGVFARGRVGAAAEQHGACADRHDGGSGDPNQQFLVHLELSVRPRRTLGDCSHYGPTYAKLNELGPSFRLGLTENSDW